MEANSAVLLNIVKPSMSRRKTSGCLKGFKCRLLLFQPLFRKREILGWWDSLGRAGIMTHKELQEEPEYISRSRQNLTKQGGGGGGGGLMCAW